LKFKKSYEKIRFSVSIPDQGYTPERCKSFHCWRLFF